MLLGLLVTTACVAAMGWAFMALTAPSDEASADDAPGISRWQSTAVGDAGACQLEILEAVNEAGTRYRISGIARAPAGATLWILAHGEETTGKYWPQIPPVKVGADHRFSELIYLGGFHQTGRHFEVALVAVDGREQHRMGELWERGMHDDWVPIDLPAGVCPASVRAIEKPWL